MADNEIVYGVRVDASGAKSGAAEVKRAFNQGLANAGTGAGATTGLTAGLGSSVTTFGKSLASQIPLIGRYTGAIGSLAGAAGLAGLAAGAAKTAWGLGELANSVKRSHDYFVAFSGGISEANRYMEAMQRATGGAVDEQTAMQAASKYLSMGLASNADELQKITHIAVMLGGGTRTATESMEEFALLLANQSILRLDTFGISGARVRQRIEELQAATAGLSREQAFMQAVMEEGTKKVEQLEAAGVRAGTSTERLTAAWRDLRTELGKSLGTGGTVSWAKDTLTNAMTMTTLQLQGNPKGWTGPQWQIDWFNAQDEYQDKQNKLNEALAAGDPLLIVIAADQKYLAEQHLKAAGAAYQAGLAEMTNADATQQLAKATGDLAAKQAAAANMMGQMKSQMQAASNAYDLSKLQAYEAELGALTLAAAEGPLSPEQFARWIELQTLIYGVSAAAAEAKANTAGVGVGGWFKPNPTPALPAKMVRGVEGGLLGTGNTAGWVAAPLPAPVPGSERYLAQQKVIYDRQEYEKRVSLAQSQTDKAKSDWESAVKDMANSFMSFVDKGKDYLDRLMGGPGGTTDKLAPGNNGPWEPIYRVADVVKNWQKPGADTAKWAAMYFPGMGMEQAAQAGQTALDQFRGYNLEPLYKSGILNKADVDAYFVGQQQAEANKAKFLAGYGIAGNPYAPGGQFSITGLPGTFPIGTIQPQVQQVQPPAKPQVAAQAIQPQQPAQAITQGLQVDFATPLTAQLNALRNDKAFLAAATGAGTAAAKALSDAWVAELPNTPWASAMEAAILDSLLKTFQKP